MLAARRARYGLLCVASAFALWGAARPKQVSAHAQNARDAELAQPSRASLAVPSAETAAPSPGAAPQGATVPMQTIPAGNYLPFYKGKSSTRTIPVRSFKVAIRPVSREDYLDFVRANPRWQRSRVERLWAEASYLADWAGDSDLGGADPRGAVTGVSWFAAKAYCASLGQRLATTVEWEHALNVVGPSFTVTNGGTASTNLAASLWEWTADFNSVPVAGDDGDTNGSVATLFCGAGARANDATDYGAFLRYSLRSSLKGNFALKNLGFRCAEASL